MNIGNNNVLIDAAGDLDVTGFVEVPGWVSQLTGWHVTSGGSADFRYVYTDELHAKSFIADLEQALAGGQIISKSVTTVAAPFTCPAPSAFVTLTVDDLPGSPATQVFQTGDWVVLRTFARIGGGLTIGDCVGQVFFPVTPGGTQTWSFQRGNGGNAGAMTAGTVITTKSLVLDYGVSGNGYYEVSAVDGLYGANSPYAQLVTWTTSPVAANRTLQARYGHLIGVTGVDEWGLFAGSGSTAADQYLIAANDRVILNNIDFRTQNGIGGMARNMIGNADCRATTSSWGVNTNTGLPITFGTGLNSTWELDGFSGGCYYVVTGTPANGTVSQALLNAVSDFIPVVAGSYYETSAYVAQQQATSTVMQLQFLDASLAQTALYNGNTCTVAAPGGGQSLDRYCRLGVLGVAPATSVYARPVIRTTYDGTLLTPYVFFVHVFFGETTPKQTQLSPWGPPGQTIITGGLIQTGTIIARNIQAGTITANEIAANAVTAAKILAGSVDATKINVSALSAITANLGTVTAGTISGVTVNGVTINAGTLNGTTIAGGSINIGSGRFTVDASGNLTATGANISNGTITAGTINIGGTSLSVATGLTIGGPMHFTGFITAHTFLCVDASGNLYGQTNAC